MSVSISVIIPVKNGAATIEKCLEGIKQQTLFSKVEVIVIDSGSEDNTLNIIAQYPFVKIYSIAATEFNHGTTRNYGVTLATGDLIVMTVQDAIPSDELWLQTMAQHFNDPEVVGVCGQQLVPHDADKNPHEWFRLYSVSNPVYLQLPPEQFNSNVPLKELYKLCGWDNVNAMYRKTALLECPFRKVSFGEDMAWAKANLLSGKKIVYDSSSRVYHYHHATYDYTYRRSLTTLYFIYKNFNFIKSIKYTKTDFLKVIYRNFKYKAKWHWVLFNWTKMNAAINAHRDVVAHLQKGEKALDLFHKQICGTPPQGKQNIK